MSDPGIRITPLGDGCALIELGNAIDPGVNDRAITLAERISSSPFPGFIDCAPAYASVSVHFEPTEVFKAFGRGPLPFEAVRKLMEEMIRQTGNDDQRDGRLVEIPAVFGGEHGPDLDLVAEISGLPPDEVIEIFLEREYRVFMIGFLPGFPYMGSVAPEISTPRRQTPRTRVPGGSIGIAGDQTGIYPVESPGGWQLIGRTGMSMFDPSSDPPALLRAGDRVRFVMEKETSG